MKTLLLLMTLLIATACQTTVVTHGIPNLAVVKPGVWRGGQPTADGWAYLKSLGVQTVVKLNPTEEAEDDAARKLGMAICYCPLSLRDQLLGITKSNVVTHAVLCMTNLGGIYVHCEHGQDRTGLVVGVYRVMVDGWTKDRAYAEMKAHGFHPELWGLQHFWNEFHE